MRVRQYLWLAIPFLLSLTACHNLNDDRIPRMPVNIDLSNAGVWNAYGVQGYGLFNYFILNSGTVLPPGFPYSYNSSTGYGGVLLIGGQNPYTGEVGPLAYDLSCPVERSPTVRVGVDPNTYEAICPECGSHYNVTEANGAPVEGIAVELGYALTPYRCYATVEGGYVIRD